MKNDNQTHWNELRKQFTIDLSKGVSFDGALHKFVEAYVESTYLKYTKSNEEPTVTLKKDEHIDVYFERKMTPIWQYVYELNSRLQQLENKNKKYNTNQYYDDVNMSTITSFAPPTGRVGVTDSNITSEDTMFSHHFGMP